MGLLPPVLLKCSDGIRVFLNGEERQREKGGLECSLNPYSSLGKLSLGLKCIPSRHRVLPNRILCGCLVVRCMWVMVLIHSPITGHPPNDGVYKSDGELIGIGQKHNRQEAESR